MGKYLPVFKERRARQTDPTTADIDIIDVSRETPIPQQFEELWASEENDRNLQLLVKVIVCNQPYADAAAIYDEPLPSKATDGED